MKPIYEINTTNDFILAHPNLIEKSYVTAQSEYLILYEDTNITNQNDKTLENYHSIILENPSRNVLSFAPPKNIEFSDLTELLQSSEFCESPDNIHVSEFIEGTLIHFFYDERISSWEIATKHAVGGRYSYYHIPDQYTPTYREMMMEAFHLDRQVDIKMIPFLETLSKKYSYSFVLQHPQNHIVIPIETPKVYLVAVYEIDSISQKTTFISPLEYQSWENLQMYSSEPHKLIYFPTTYSVHHSMEDEKNINATKIVPNLLKYINEYASVYTPSHHMGIIFTNLLSGKRTSFFNPNYLEMSKMRGNHSNLLYQFFCLKRIHKIQSFLYFFPQYNTLFHTYKRNYEELVTKIHQYYFSYYVKKLGETIPKKYFHHIYQIHHSIFLPSLQKPVSDISSLLIVPNQNKIIVRRNVVKEYMDDLDPILLVSLLQNENTFFLNNPTHE